MLENTIVTEEGTAVLWDMLTDEQKAAILAINAAAQDNKEKARIAAGEPAGLAVKEVNK